jgi:two-component system, chemotaxis family, protein-glutamate methylesterase/glutaminase
MAKDEIARVVVVGGSAGSLDVLLKLVPAFPVRAGICYIIVLHRKADTDSILAGILSSRTAMPVREVEDKEEIHANHVYVAPADYHLLIENKEAFSLDSSEKVHYSRPSIDVTFESVADVFKEKAIGILLSGANADGARGLKRIKQAGGFTIAQEPGSAEVSFMPAQAIKIKAVSRVWDVEQMASFLVQLIEGLQD